MINEVCCSKPERTPKADDVVKLIVTIREIAMSVSSLTAKKMERLQIVDTAVKEMAEKPYELGRDTLAWSPLFDEMRESLMVIKNCLLKIEDNVKRAEV